MLQICEHHLDLLRDPDHAEGGRYYDREVDQAAGKIVSGLSLARLIELEGKTNAMLRSGQPVDGEFWDLVLKKIHVEKSVVRVFIQVCLDDTDPIQAKLNSIHEVVLKNRLEQFKKRQREEAAKQQQELGNKMVAQGETSAFGGDIHADGDGEGYEDDADDEDDIIEDYSRSMSPGVVDVRDLAQEDRRLQVLTEAEFKRSIVSPPPGWNGKKADQAVQSTSSSRRIIIRTQTPRQGRRQLLTRSHESNSLATISSRS